MGIRHAIANLTHWAARSSRLATDTTFDAVKTIVRLTPNKELNGSFHVLDTGPYGIITLFLCHVVVWAFASVSTRDQKMHLLQYIEEDNEVRRSDTYGVLHGVLGDRRERDTTLPCEHEKTQKKILFKCAAEKLTKFEIWGASLNLALLLHHRSEM